ncbi:MAG: rhamnogalacturonan acetylesterase [Marinilabiliaceae bacterium]|nr:rhamnogalacturonan acetylesterase [Marinilabiliaceae bacterium]
MKIISLSAIFTILLFAQCSNDKPLKPTIYIIGDSTVKNGQGDGKKGLWGWGDFIEQYFDTSKVVIKNCALGGTSSRTFISKGLWQPILDSLKEGDFLFIQFGHNDAGPINDTIRARGTLPGIGNETEKIRNLLTGYLEIVHTYGHYLKLYITEAINKGANPIIISPIPRNDWNGDKIIRNNLSYGLWAKQIANKKQVPFIDLNEKMAIELEKLGENNVTGKYFYKRDHTHTTVHGAILNASIIANSINENKLCNLSKFTLSNPQIKLPPKKNIFIIGDSTVQGKDDKSSITGWALFFPDYIDTLRVNIIDNARGGRSSRTFKTEGLWDETRKHLSPGDFVLIQFGHNDGGNIDEGKRRASLKGTGDQLEISIMPDGSKEAVHTYGWYLKTFVKETLEKKAIPIIISQVPRNKWNNKKVERVNDSYGLWAKEVAQLEGVEFIDLNEAVAYKYEIIGSDSVQHFFPKDHTHTNKIGAQLNAITLAEQFNINKKSLLHDFIELY